MEDEGLRQKPIDWLEPKAKYSIHTLPMQIRHGVQPEIGGRKVGFVGHELDPEEPPRREWVSRTLGVDLYLKLGGGLALTQMPAWKVPGRSPEGNEMLEVYIPEWSQKDGVNTFSVDAVTGQMYVKTDEQLIAVAEKCHTKTVVGTGSTVHNPYGEGRYR